MKTFFMALFIMMTFVVPEVDAQHYRRVHRRKRVIRTPQTVPRRPLQVDPRLGLYIGGGLMTIYNAESDNDLTRSMHTGFGFDMLLGMRFSRNAAFEIALQRSWVGSEDKRQGAEAGVLDGLTLDLLLFPLPRSVVIEPFVDVGGGLYRYERDGMDVFDAELRGAGFQIGGGLLIRLTDSLGISLKGLYRGVYADNEGYDVSAVDTAYFNQIVGQASIRLQF
jgi:hypothetical protein